MVDIAILHTSEKQGFWLNVDAGGKLPHDCFKIF